MTIVERIQELIATDDDDQSERLIQEYQDANAEQRAAIDGAFICLCGYGLGTLIEQENKRGE
jgi:hypothetical protein